jgi:5-methylcytosine-specific restriction endonuclease McrBC regulatory subunit McrC
MRLAADDLLHLLDLVKGSGDSVETKVIQAVAPSRETGVYIVTPGPFVGRMGLPSGETLDIQSRFPIEDVIELIRLSARLPIKLDRLHPDESADRFLIDVIAQAFAREADRLVASGLAKGYQTTRFTRPPYPGIPDVALHLGRYAARPDKLVTSARRITHDVEINRALAAALDVVSRVPLIQHVRREVAALRPSFLRVRRTGMAADAVSRIPLDKQTTRYREALGLVELILRSQSLVPEGAARRGVSVLFNMPKVWEGYVTRWAAELWGPDHRIEAPFGFDLTADGSLRSEADVTVWDGDRLVAIYDAKYKWPGDKPSMGDVYQMVTYCARLRLDEATLVYPAPAKTTQILVEGVTIRTIGLRVPPGPIAA